jgi:hypothetical protein
MCHFVTGRAAAQYLPITVGLTMFVARPVSTGLSNAISVCKDASGLGQSAQIALATAVIEHRAGFSAELGVSRSSTFSRPHVEHTD